jgi:hypothetical protein
MAKALPLIEFDAASFNPKRITPVTHNLVGHPLLSLPKLRELALRLNQKQVRFHATTAGAGSNFERTTEEHKHSMSLDDALANMDNSGSWIALHNVQTDPEYRALLDEALDQVRDRLGAKDPGMFNRAFWIFIQSPGSTTPFHMDHEQNFLMQVAGKKTARVWHPEDCLTDYVLEVFHSEYTRKEVAYDPKWNEVAHKFDLEPGQGVYMPFTGPHLVNNLDNVSITLSMTYCTDETRRVETLYRGNHALRKLGRKMGIAPAPVGRRPMADSLKHAAFRSYLTARAKMRGRDPRLPDWVVTY